MNKILLIEDDKDLNLGLTYDLRAEGYQVYSARNLGEGMTILKEEEADLLLLDGNLPDGDGFDFCRAIKREEDLPVIFLTARDLEADEITGFNCGADDYITKPFSMAVLHKRIEAVFRRGVHKNDAQKNLYNDGYLLIDFDSLTAYKDGESLVLTPTEFKLLRLLIANAQKVVTKTLILEKLWDYAGNFVDEHTVAVNINRLRKKLEDETHQYIKTMYGMGYQWKGEK
ncbi:Transcriptional regulatory protein YycF [uncultured Eubacterium sp.]|nr:Transcriptional regulatory protein YycF [uncultured Eubacterium sp.]